MQQRPVERVYGDGAYDKSPCYKKCYEQGIQPIFPPQKGAILHDLEKEPWMGERNDAIQVVSDLGDDETAREIWRSITQAI